MKLILSALLALFSLHGVTQAALIDRGGGLIYDDVLNITWLQDANYAKTSGYSTEFDGRMSWDQAKTWTDDLTFGGYDDWRLPSVAPINGTAFYFGNFFDQLSGKADVGYNIGARGTAYEGAISSEMAYMYYVNLGLESIVNPDGTFNPDYGIFGDGTIDLEGDVGLVRNLQPELYWSGTEVPNTAIFFSFNFQLGEQILWGKNAGLTYAWAVRDGDVSIATAPNGVPEPGTLGLLALGIAGFGLARRRR